MMVSALSPQNYLKYSGFLSGFRQSRCLNIMKQFAIGKSIDCPCCSACFAQQKTDGWLLDKMPADLETEYALSALPPALARGRYCLSA